MTAGFGVVIGIGIKILICINLTHFFYFNANNILDLSFLTANNLTEIVFISVRAMMCDIGDAELKQ